MHSKIIILFVTALAISACNSNPSIPSSGSPAGLPPTGAPSSSSTGTPPSGSSPGRERSQNPASTQPGQESAPASGKQKSADNNSGQTDNSQAGEKTDDQILAEALDEFGNKNTQGSNGENQDAGQVPTIDSKNGSATDAEKAAQLDKRLGDKFARFDDLILTEREASSREGNGKGSGDFGDGDDAGNSGGEPLQTASVEQPQGERTGLPRTNDLPSNSVTNKPPADVGAGQDDDIIARQLREAAMKEQDPELRAKLWDEYRKYKKNS